MKALEEYFKNDAEFAQEIISSFIDNLKEFRSSLLQAVNQQNPLLFSSSYHKMRSTLGFTENERLQQQADLIDSLMKEKGLAAVDTRTQNLFCRICTSSINELEGKLNTYKTAV